MPTTRCKCVVGLMLLSVLAALPIRAQEAITLSAINDDALRDITGVALINQSAGDGNLQLNSAALAVNATGLAVAFSSSAQHTDPAPTDVELDAFAIIDDDAFANARGLISVSQASGISNQQVNFASLAVGADVNVLAEAELSQSRSGDPPAAGAEPEGARLTHIDDGAFLDASGVIQVNQVAGVSNNTFNRFALTMSANQPGSGISSADVTDIRGEPPASVYIATRAAYSPQTLDKRRERRCSAALTAGDSDPADPLMRIGTGIAEYRVSVQMNEAPNVTTAPEFKDRGMTRHNL